MARVGSKPVVIPSGVELTITDVGGHTNVKVKGPKGLLSKDFLSVIKIEKKDNQVLLTATNADKKTNALHGTYRVLINNMVTGVTKGFEKQLTWEGVGYRIQPKGKGLTLQMGFSHDIDFSPVEGIAFKLGENNQLTIEGIDKEVVGQTAANIRDVKPVEPYKGKGLRYIDEYVHRKAGKAAK
jgi:large subunit ribosomal protein L6